MIRTDSLDREAKKHLTLIIENMYRYEGKPVWEIARYLNISESEVVKTLEKASLIR